MLKVNLVPEVQQKKDRSAKVNYFTMLICVILIATTTISIIVIYGINLTNDQVIKDRDKKITNTKKEIDKYKDLEKTVLSLERGLASAKKILDGSTNWTKLFPHLENATPQDTRYADLELHGNTIHATIQAISVDSIARFVESYKKYQIINLTGKAGVEDTISVKVDEEDPIIVIPKTDGNWNSAVRFDATKNHKIMIEKNTPQKESDEIKSDDTEADIEPIQIILNYGAAKKEIVQETKLSERVNTEIKSLFSDIEVCRYEWKEQGLFFDTKFSFNGDLLW